MKLTIFHFGDSHWIPIYTNPADVAMSRPTLQQAEFYRRYKECFDRLPLSEYCGKADGDKIAVIHSGDFANCYPLTRHPDGCRFIDLEHQFKDIKSRHIRHLKDTFSSGVLKADYFVAVPGNHDLNIDDRGQEENVRFRHFINALDGWRTPFPKTLGDVTASPSEVSIERIPILGKPSKQVALVLYNSAIDVWEEIDEYGDKKPIQSTSVHFGEHKLQQSDYLRIAVLHHNILPQFGQDDSAVRKDMFKNNGNFNAYLVENNFKLVLSGHQHAPNDAYFSIARCLNDNGHNHSLFDSSVLSLSAPSFLRQEPATAPGFNVIEIDLLDDSNFAAIRVTKYRYDRVERGFSRKQVTHHVLIPRIDEIGSIRTQYHRLRTLITVIDRLYDPNFPGSEVEQLWQRMSNLGKADHFGRIVQVLETNYHRDGNNIFGMYSVAIMPPHVLIEHQSAFVQLFDDQIAAATKRKHDEHSPPWADFCFRFSGPLYDAIQCSLSNADSFRVLDMFLSSKVDMTFELRLSNLVLNSKGGSSLSNWKRNNAEVQSFAPLDGSSSNQPREQKGNLSIQRGENDVVHTFSSADVDKNGFYEFARIVIWPPETFKSRQARDYVSLHEKWLVPLFWLDPERLRGNDNKQRHNIGYFVLYVKEYRDYRFTEMPIPETHPQVYYNNSDGEAITTSDRLDVAMWGIGGAPEEFRRNHSYITNEVSMLLRSPDIMLAVDALSIVRLSSAQELRRLMNSQFGSYDL